MPRAGKNVRALAFRRRLKAMQFFLATGVLLTLPIGLYWLIQQLSVGGRFANAATIAPRVFWLYPVCLAIAGYAGFRGAYLWKRANHADQGARAEEEIAHLLESLKTKGWQIEYGVQDRQVGDVDVFLISPKGNAYTIDVKSHRGYVFAHQNQLYRKLGQATVSFEKDFLSQAKRQAVVMKERRGLKFVTPIVVFSDATVNIMGNPIAGVHVLHRHNLLDCLRTLE
ncbi:MAG TPA: nuclease-related domain-containing protein [Microcoleaceae cyanobacterium]